MFKYIILINSFEKQSREFVNDIQDKIQSSNDYKILDWINQSKEWFDLGLGSPSAFPTVAKLETKELIRTPDNLDLAIELLDKTKEEKTQAAILTIPFSPQGETFSISYDDLDELAPLAFALSNLSPKSADTITFLDSSQNEQTITQNKFIKYISKMIANKFDVKFKVKQIRKSKGQRIKGVK